MHEMRFELHGVEQAIEMLAVQSKLRPAWLTVQHEGEEAKSTAAGHQCYVISPHARCHAIEGNQHVAGIVGIMQP